MNLNLDFCFGFDFFDLILFFMRRGEIFEKNNDEI
jgi:hypothetical protein